jgi:hypothetical protein
MTIRSILGAYNLLINQTMHLQLKIPIAFLSQWIKGSFSTWRILCHNIVSYILALYLLAHLLVSLTSHIFWQQALPMAITTLVSLILNPQHILSKPRSKSGWLPHPGHPGSAKVSLIYHTEKCTDQFHVYFSTIVGFTKSWLWLLLCSGQANLASQQHAMWCWALYI